MVTDTFNDRDRTGVPNAETFAGSSIDKEFAASGTIETSVPNNRILRGNKV